MNSSRVGRQSATLTCPVCRQTLLAPESATAQVQCPQCSTIFPAVPTHDPQSSLPIATVVLTPTAAPARQGESRAPSRRRPPVSGSMAVSILIGLVCFSIVITLALGVAFVIAMPPGDEEQQALAPGGGPAPAIRLEMPAPRPNLDWPPPRQFPPAPWQPRPDTAEQSKRRILGGVTSLEPAILEKTKKATVYIMAASSQGVSTGSGFLVRRQDRTAWVITNYHVVAPPEQEQDEWPGRGLLPPMPRMPRFMPRLQERPLLTVVFDSGTPQERSGRALIVSHSEEPDLALLRVDDVANLPEPLGTKAPELRETERVFFFGFPFGAALAVDRSNPAVTVNQGPITALRRDQQGRLRAVQVESDLNSGNSGGPAINATGELVGIAVAIVRGTNIGLLIHPSELETVMRPRIVPLQVALQPMGACFEFKAGAQVFDPDSSVREPFVLFRVQPMAAPLPKAGPNQVWAPLHPAERLPLRMMAGKLEAAATLPDSKEGELLLYQFGYVAADGQQHLTPPGFLRSPSGNRQALRPEEEGPTLPPTEEPRAAPPPARIGKVASPKGWPGLLAYWSCDEGTGQVVEDQAGYGRAGQVSGHDWVPGVRGQALQLDGRQGKLDFGDDPCFNFAEGAPFTFTCWIKSRSSFGQILSIRRREDGRPVITMALRFGKLHCEVGDDSGDGVRTGFGVKLDQRLNDDQWHHLVLTRSAEGHCRIYINGAVVEPEAAWQDIERPNRPVRGAITTDRRLWGAEARPDPRWGAAAPPFARAFAGQLDELCVFERELTADEIKQLAGQK